MNSEAREGVIISYENRANAYLTKPVGPSGFIDGIETERKLPSSKAVRRRAERFCQQNDYAVPDCEWIGV